MNADPFRPLPTRSDYEADMRLMDEKLEAFHVFDAVNERRDGSPVVYVMLGAVIVAVCAAVVWWL
jgi:hypothetical protein